MPLPNCAVAVPTPSPKTRTQIRIFLFMKHSLLFAPSQIGRHFVVVVVRQCEIARKIDLHTVSLPDGHRGHDVQELVEDLRRGLSGALRKSLPHQVGTGCVKGACYSAFRDGSYRSDRQRDTEDPQVVVIDLVPQARVADLVEALELVEADGIAVRH